MKKVVAILITLSMIMALTGCFGAGTKVTIKNDGSGTFSYCIMVDNGINKVLKDGEDFKSVYKALSKFNLTYKMYEDVYYACYEREIPFKDIRELKNILDGKVSLFEASVDGEKEKQNDMGLFRFVSADVSTEHFQVVVGTEKEGIMDEGYYDGMSDAMFGLLSVSFDKEITDTNGSLSEDKMTASWKLDLNKENILIQASTAGTSSYPVDTKAPVVSPVKNNGYYKDGVDLTIRDNVGVKSVLCNKKKASCSMLIWKDGKYNVTAQDFAGNKTSINFIVDGTAPTIKGVKNGTTYRSKRTIRYSDRFGIKSAKLNGKSIKSGKTVSKKGKYTLKVMDKAGNISSVVFYIKK